MKFACPACAAEYEVPDARMKPGRSARCARCGEVWKPEAVEHPVAPPEPAASPAEPKPRPEPEPLADPAWPAAITAMDRLAAPASRPPRPVALLAAWLATALVLAGAGASAVVWRAEIMQTWPPSIRILAVFDPSPGHSTVMSGNKPR